MTIKQFIEEAKKIGCPGSYISAETVGKYSIRDDGQIQIWYRCYCSGCRRMTDERENPLLALSEFAEIHRPNLVRQHEDMIITEEAIIEQPALLRKIMD